MNLKIKRMVPEKIRNMIRPTFIAVRLFLRPSNLSPNIELTNKCNARCKMCPRQEMVTSGELKVGEIDFELFKKIINECSENEKTGVTLVGLGDPLMYGRLKEAIMYIKNKCPGWTIKISSNGIALNNENAKMLVECLGEDDVFTLSLNAHNPAAYRWLMGVDCYDLVVSNIKNFLAIRNKLNDGKALTIVIQMLETKETGTAGEEFVNFWRPFLNKKDIISIKPLLNWGGKINTKNLGANDKGKRYPCFSLWSAIVVDRDGNVFPCCDALSTREKSALLLGNINEGKSLKEIYSHKIGGIRKKHLFSQWDEISDCSQCDFWSDSPNLWLKIGKRWVSLFK